MQERKIIIQNKTGMHARPASILVGFLKKFDESDIYFVRGDAKFNVKSILNLLSMGLSQGSEVTLVVEGGDEEEVINEIVKFMEELEE